MPGEVFGALEGARVFASPGRYVQGPGLIDRIGDLLAPLEPVAVAVLASPGRRQEAGDRLARALDSPGVTTHFADFGGESSFEEIESRVDELSGRSPDVLIAFGGGKCIDTAKGVAHRLGVPLVVIPSLASNDGPCSASSVIYDVHGTFTGVEFYPASPALVVVDTELIANAPAKYLAAGMGDALATWYEAEVAARNPVGVSTFGSRPTRAALAIAEACADTLFRHGAAAMEAAARHTVDDALEHVVEANTLLSGVGFESGGLAAAHGVGMSFTALPHVHARYLHGEMVGFGLLTQLALEQRIDEAEKVGGFLTEIGLPVTLEQLSVDRSDDESLAIVSRGAAEFPFTANMQCDAGFEDILEAMVVADDLGLLLV